jgi:hypothetical protein
VDRLHLNTVQEAVTRTFSRRAALAGLAGGGVAATLTLAGLDRTRAASSPTSPVGMANSLGSAPNGTEILWDTWGTPHIFAADAPGLFYAFGWAQAHNHGDLLLQLYALARGRGAEFFGEDLVLWDRMSRTMGLPDQGVAWYEAQSPDFRANLDAFAAGINAYAEQHGDKLDDTAKAVLPVDGTDILAHIARVLSLFLGISSGVLGVEIAGSMPGSNGWAVAPPTVTRCSSPTPTSRGPMNIRSSRPTSRRPVSTTPTGRRLLGFLS